MFNPSEIQLGNEVTSTPSLIAHGHCLLKIRPSKSIIIQEVKNSSAWKNLQFPSFTLVY